MKWWKRIFSTASPRPSIGDVTVHFEGFYDKELPDHPLSRVRTLMKSVGPSLMVSDRLSRFPPFKWPTDLSFD